MLTYNLFSNYEVQDDKNYSLLYKHAKPNTITLLGLLVVSFQLKFATCQPGLVLSELKHFDLNYKDQFEVVS